MGVKVKKTLFLKDLPKNISKNFSKALKRDIGDEIIIEISQGRSPETGKQYKPYSDSYAKKKGRKAPVDLIKTGEMLDSIKVKQNKKGQVKVSFTDEKAEYHQKGGKNLPQRKLLPTGKKGFSSKLTRIINKILDMAVKKSIKKQ